MLQYRYIGPYLINYDLLSDDEAHTRRKGGPFTQGKDN